MVDNTACYKPYIARLHYANYRLQSIIFAPKFHLQKHKSQNNNRRDYWLHIILFIILSYLFQFNFICWEFFYQGMIIP